MVLYLDIETDTSHNKIWMCVTFDEEHGFVCHKSATTLKPLIEKADTVVAHNLIGFDASVLKKSWQVEIPTTKYRDTLIMSRLWKPDVFGGHSLDEWGKRLDGKKKSDYQRIFWRLQGVRKFDKKDVTHWNNPHMPLMEAYCRRDVAVLVDLYKKLDKELEGWGESVELEHQVAIILKGQEDHGFKFDDEKAGALLATLGSEVVDIESELQSVFPPIVTERWSEKTGKKLKDSVEVFNPGSRPQIAKRLKGLGVKFKKETEKGTVVIDEKVLASIDLPEAKLINRYLLLQKRISQIKSWCEAAGRDGRVHGRVITNGAVTGRMTHHSPNMAQIPNTGSEYGAECRECWTVEDGNWLVGVDASGLELRMLAHYMKDPAYIKTVVEGSSKDGTDVHTVNQKAAGLPTRDQAKTFIYAFLYGAGAAKIGSIAGGGYAEGEKLINRFLKKTPALEKLKNRVIKNTVDGALPGLDGRKLWVRSEHAALNTLLQGAGAAVMKKALVIFDTKLGVMGGDVVQYCANVHDEVQLEVKGGEKLAHEVGQMMVDSIREAGVAFNMRCPLDGEYHVGKNWKDTH